MEREPNNLKNFYPTTAKKYSLGSLTFAGTSRKREQKSNKIENSFFCFDSNSHSCHKSFNSCAFDESLQRREMFRARNYSWKFTLTADFRRQKWSHKKCFMRFYEDALCCKKINPIDVNLSLRHDAAKHFSLLLADVVKSFNATVLRDPFMSSINDNIT